MVSTRLIELAWSETDEYRETVLDVPELSDREWAGWAWYKILPTWIEARPVISVDHISDEKRAHLLLLKHAESRKVVCIYPVSTSTGTSTLSRVNTDLVLRARRVDRSGSARVSAIIGQAASVRDVHRLIESCVAQARSYVSCTPVDQLVPLDEGDWRQGPFGGIGFCTWSSLGEDIPPTHSPMSHLLVKLASSGITIQSFILDDGWHSQKTYASGDASPYRCKTGPEEEKGRWQLRGLWAFEANDALHPGGLKGSIAETKAKLGSQCEVGVWLGLTGGYWDGIHPDSPLIARYKCRRYATSRDRLPGTPNVPFTPAYIPGGRGHMWLPPPDQALQYWRDWFAYICSSGATFLKVDVQGSLGILDGVEGAECQLALWRTMVQASDEVFGPGRVIHCMSQHESMHGGIHGLGIVTGGRKFVWRNSDDFGLVGKKKDVQQQHIFTNLTNSLLTNHLALIPDPDMFMTADQSPVYHALLRVLYPGPLLLSDRPGEHDLALIGRMTAKDASGTSRVLRTVDYARPLASRIIDPTLVGVANGKGLWAASRVGTGAIIAVWNVHNDEAATRVEDVFGMNDLADALDTDIQGEYLVVESDLRSGGFKRCTVVSARAPLSWEVSLERLECAAFWITPLIDVGKAKVAVLGLSDKLAGLAAVTAVSAQSGELSTSVVGCTLRSDALLVKCSHRGRLAFAVIGDADIDIHIEGRRMEPTTSRLSGQVGSLLEIELGETSEDHWEVTLRPSA